MFCTVQPLAVPAIIQFVERREVRREARAFCAVVLLRDVRAAHILRFREQQERETDESRHDIVRCHYPSGLAMLPVV